MEKKSLVFIVMFALMFIPFVSSIPPVQTTTNQDIGLNIFYPQFEYAKQNTDFTLHLHTSNKSDGLQLSNSVVDCYLHLYNTTGSHSFESGILTKDSNGYDHEILIKGTNFTDLGMHSYYIWCNASTIGGEEKGLFQVTNTGEEFTTEIVNSYLGLLAILIFLFLVNIGAISFLDDKRFKTDEEGMIIDKGSIVNLKPILYVVGWVLLMAIFFISSNFSLAYLNFTMFGDLFFTIYKVMFYLTLPLFFIWIVWIFVRIFQDKETKKMLERGAGIGDI